MARKPKIGLALGSGGARGWCHIGILRALAEMKIGPQMIAGTSMGALVGAAWAGNRLDALEDWVLSLTPSRFISLIDPRLRSGGLVEARQIEQMLREIGLPEKIEDLDRPFTAIATDMETGREIWFSQGPLYKAVRASVGIPGVMSPTRYQDMWLLDGGLTNPVPVSAARALGADVIIAANPNAKPHGKLWKPREPKKGPGWVANVLPAALTENFGITEGGRADEAKPNYFDVLNAAIDVMSDTILRARLAGEPPHVMLNAAFEDLTVLELYRGQEAIAEGRKMVRREERALREHCLGEH